MAYSFPLIKMFSFIFLISELALTQTIEGEKVLPNGVINFLFFFYFRLKKMIIRFFF